MKKLLLVSFIAAITLTNSWSKGFGKEEVTNFCKDKPMPLIGKQFDGKKASKSVLSMVAGKYAYSGVGALLLYSKGYYLLKLPTNHDGMVIGSDAPDLMASGGILGGCSKEQLSEVISNNNLNIKNFKLLKRYNNPKNKNTKKKAKKKSLTLPDRLYVAVPKSIGIKALEVGVASPKGRFITLYKNRDNLANLIKTNPKKFKDISLILEVNIKKMSKDNYKFYTTKQGHFAIKMIPGKYILVKGANIISSKSSISSANKNIKQKNRFVQKVDKLLKNRKQIVTTFRNLTNFDWHEVCFFDNSSLNIKFYNNHKSFDINIVLPKKYYIEESYVDGSPIREIYKNNKLSKKNCWSKGTKFIIKKVNTKDGKNLIIKVKDQKEKI